ncbi:hypothetical protein ACFL2O_05830 [Thermodesulfobacteriota bacterium]
MTAGYMREEPRSIFRKEALDRYSNLEEATALPGLISPRFFVFFWVLFGLLLALGAWLCFAEVKTYTFGRGIIVGLDQTGSDGQERRPRVVSFFPADMHAKLAVGEGLMTRFKSEHKWHKQTIITVEPRVLSPAEVKEKFGFDIYLPVAVAISRSEDKEGNKFSQKILRDNTVEVRIESGSRAIASFLPVLGALFEKE